MQPTGLLVVGQRGLPPIPLRPVADPGEEPGADKQKRISAPLDAGQARLAKGRRLTPVEILRDPRQS